MTERNSLTRSRPRSLREDQNGRCPPALCKGSLRKRPAYGTQAAKRGRFKELRQAFAGLAIVIAIHPRPIVGGGAAARAETSLRLGMG